MRKDQSVEFLTKKIKNEQIRVRMIHFVEVTPIESIKSFLNELFKMQGFF